MSDHLDSIHRARCQCDRTGPETGDLNEVWRLAIAEGWYVDSRVCLCPDCRAFGLEWQARVDRVERVTEVREKVKAKFRQRQIPRFKTTLSWPDIAAFATSVQPMEEE